MDNLREQFIRSKAMYEGIIVNIRHDVVTLPNGKEATREVIEHPGAVAVVPVTADGKFILVRQYRHAAGEILLEIPAGKLAEGEDPGACALRELEEETGFAAKTIRKVMSVFTTPGFTNEIIHIYVAEDLVATQQQPDDDEFLTVECYTREQIKAMLADGTICDAKTALGLLLAGAA